MKSKALIYKSLPTYDRQIIVTVEFEFATAEFDSLFRLSKFVKYPGFEQRRKGHIVITNHTDESWYRNIKIRRIN